MQWTGRTMAVAAACAVAGAAAPAAPAAPTFGLEAKYDVLPGKAKESLAVGLLNGDADLDVVTTSQQDVGSIRGAAGTAFSGTFAQPLNDASGAVHQVALADVDLDGRTDALTSSTVSKGLFEVHRGLGTGAFEAQVFAPAPGYLGGGLASADFDQDGDADVAVLGRPATSTTAGSLIVMRGAAGTAFTKGQVLTMPKDRGVVRAGQLNAGSDPDLLVVHPVSKLVRVYRGATGATFGGLLTSTFSQEPRDVAIGSLNGDAHPDFAVATRTYLSFHFGKADGTFTEQAFADDYQDLRHVRIADVDGDGHNDVLLVDAEYSSELVVLAGKSDGTFANVLEKPLAVVPPGFEVADLDADRAPDLVAQGADALRTARNTTPRADLAVRLTAPATATTTADARYSLAATNAGPTTASGVVLTLDLPSSFTFKGAASGCTYTSSLRRVTCTVGSLGSGATASRVITVRPTAKGQFPATARVTSARGDFNRTNNAVAGLTTVS